MTNRGTVDSWTIVLPRSRAASLAELRGDAGLMVLEQSDQIWLKGNVSDALGAKLLRVPAEHWFAIGSQGELVERGHLVPHGWLPEGPWVPLADWLEVTLPTVQPHERLVAETSWRLVPAERFVEPNLLLISVHEWGRYGVSAPQARLDRWRFALNELGEAAVHGEPVPPLPGWRFVERGGIALPVGLRMEPALAVPIVRTVLQLDEGDIVLLRSDGYERIPAWGFVSATRAAIRASLGRLYA
jgi:hypothetical protein